MNVVSDRGLCEMQKVYRHKVFLFDILKGKTSKS